ncbi:molybdenum cofactor guanylyltransferase [Psychrobacter sp. K31L]|uniref:molybdenum cofactor guanylyltransferase n=1 Tax=Psychrobacter sp. K31L TaxID=2820758 RepID=UPI001B33D24E|nr:NTP transferase domain-containing protein [Psychrobacter sp. K31L]MBP3946773.1 NTP transferase domain-containing protein [Psychrobacter sp. K31L]
MMANTAPHLNSLAGVVILAGGASKRMGVPKAELTLPTGERLLDYHVRHALELTAADLNTAGFNIPIMIADNERGFTVDLDLSIGNPQSPIMHIADYNPIEGNEQSDNGGALVAIESALQTLAKLTDATPNQKSGSSWLLVISCDSLIPATDLWQKLQPVISQVADKKVVCLTDDSHLYPLLGLYQLSIEADLKAYIDSGQRRVISCIKPLTQAVPLTENWQHLTNFNTPEDFQRACAALSDL